VLRWLFRGLVALLLLLALGAAGGYFWLRGSLPQLDGRVAVAGLGHEVEIVRDRHGVPHITAGSLPDAAFGLGFAHAQDRLWQMETNRRIGAGRLAEVLGKPALSTDLFLRTLGLYRQAEAALAGLPAETREVLDAYARGVNAYLETRSGPLPPEFLLLRHRPEPWTAADSAVWVKVMALDLSMNWNQELLRLRMASHLPAERIVEFFPDLGPPIGLDRLAALGRGLDPGMLAGLAAAGWPQPVEGVGSNNWVVAGNRTATGKPLLANDPHLGLTAPSVWYFAHMSWPGHEVIGATFPGLPAVILGRNRRVAWGFTNTGSDVQDLVIERPDPADPGRYLSPEGPKPFALRRETIRVKDAEDVVVQVRETENGPILSDALQRARSALPEGDLLALRWTALQPGDRTVAGGLGLMTAQNWPQFVDALRDFNVPPQSMVYADVDGNIGFYAPGRVPARPLGTQNPGFMPVAGWEAASRWSGFIPFEAMPQAFNPASGLIATANHRIVGPEYPYVLTTDWAEGYRQRRILEELLAREKHSLESFKALQTDVTSLMALEFLPRLLLVPPVDARSRQAVEMLTVWDGRMAAERPEPLLFSAWYRELTRLVMADELGSRFEEAWALRPTFMANALSGRNRWCDNVATAEAETCDQLIARALTLALDWLEARYGSDPAAWRWDEAHVAVLEHRPMSRVPYLSRLFEIRRPVPGDTYTVNVGRYRLSDDVAPFTNVHGPGLRAIYDLDDPDRSLYIHTTGQSGNPLSPFYRSFADLWATGQYIPMTTSRREIEAGALGRLVLTPG